MRIRQQYGFKGVKALCGLRYRDACRKASYIQRERLPDGKLKYLIQTIDAVKTAVN